MYLLDFLCALLCIYETINKSLYKISFCELCQNYHLCLFGNVFLWIEVGMRSNLLHNHVGILQIYLVAVVWYQYLTQKGSHTENALSIYKHIQKTNSLLFLDFIWLVEIHWLYQIFFWVPTFSLSTELQVVKS